MQNNFLEFTVRGNIKHAQSTHYGTVQGDSAVEPNPETVGGIFRNGQFGWIVNGSHIEIVSMKNGDRVSDYTFADGRSNLPVITFVTEVKLSQISSSLLAIGVQSSQTNSVIYLFAVDGSRIVNSIEIEEKVTSCCFIDSQLCADSGLNWFDGCIIVGTESGLVIIIDLFADNCLRVLNGIEFHNSEPKLCKIVASTLSFASIKSQKLAADRNGFGFGVSLENLEDAGSILSLLCLTPLLVIAVGFDDGRMLLYDLCTLDALHIAHPPEMDSPLEKLTFIEPVDDPKAFVYLWCFHSNEKNAVAVLHALMYERKTLKPNGSGFIYKNFDKCCPRLTMPIYEKYAKPISCQSITKFLTVEENFISLCVLAWASSSGAYVCVFDLNQWYKQQMPSTCDWRSSPTFLAIFPLGKQFILDVWMNGNTVTPFSSLNRPEEHFYPSSLSFDCSLLTTNSSTNLHWIGLQNQALEHLNRSGPYAILEPNRCFADMVCASLIPQFTDYSYDVNQSLKAKREFLLSIALEYNCVALLRKCAVSWADGSHLSKQPSDGLSLSTLTDWIWSRAVSIKESCNDMCASLFDHSGNGIEPRSQKVLLNFSRQLKRLFQLMDMIVTTCRRYIPGEDTLQSQRNSICMAMEYQEVLQWFLNMGLLPEVAMNEPQASFAKYRDSSYDELQAIPYPYQTLRTYYVTQRRKYANMDTNLIVPKTKSCRILYIDTFIDIECNSAILRSEWKKGMGDGLYPPNSFQAMLRILLVPGVPIERKYMLFVYLFMDLSTVLRDERYSNAIKNLIKFPAVFKMDPGLIKITQAFWNLDHGDYELAINEIISPLAQDQNMSVWQRELLIQTLILNDVPHFALRALNAPGLPISPVLEIKTLLANDLVADAFQVQRMKRDRELLMEFFRACYEQSKWHYLLNLSLNVKEEECLGEFLRSIESSLGENINFLYLLRRSKYLEAITFIDDLQQKKRSRQLDLDTPNTILSTYRLTMAPSTRQFSDLYHSLKDNINGQLNQSAKCPVPLSSQLSQSKFDLLGGVYHQSLVHTEQTNVEYWENQQKKMCGLIPSKVPFLRGLQDHPAPYESFDHQVCYPQPFDVSKKRRISDSFEEVKEAPSAKRCRIDCANSHINTTLLTSFKEKPNTSSLQAKQTEEPSEKNKSNSIETTLSTPVVMSHHEKHKKSYSLAERVSTPLSILKGRSLREKSVSSLASRRSVDSDERSIRFNLPDNNTDSIITSTPVIPDVFSYGITHRPSIHSKTTDGELSKLSCSHDENEPSECNASSNLGRKRLRSISSDESPLLTCIDVTLPAQQSSKLAKTLSMSSENSSDHQSETDLTLDNVIEESESTHRINVDEPRSDSAATHVTDHLDVDDESSDKVSSSFVFFQPNRGTFTEMASKTTQPVERIIPIEIEDIFQSTTLEATTIADSQISDESEKTPLTQSNVSNERPNTTISICTPLPYPKNLLSNTPDMSQSSAHNESDAFDESLGFRKRNLFSVTCDSFSKIERTSTIVTGMVADTKVDDIVTVQIEDSEDSCLVGTTQFETKPDEALCELTTVESSNNDITLKSSTPLEKRKQESLKFINPFSLNSVTLTPLACPRNILSDSKAELNETSYYKLSPISDSIVKKKNLFSYRPSGSDCIKENIESLNAEHTSDDANIESEKKSIEETVSNVDESEDDDDSSIGIDETEMQPSGGKVSPTPELDDENENDENSYDIYEVSSEIDLALAGEDYDIDDEESYSDDEVIDISSGSDSPDMPAKLDHEVTNNPKALADNSSIPHTAVEIAEQMESINDNTATASNLLDSSKYSEMSFMTASEGAGIDSTLNEQSYQMVTSLDKERLSDSINENINVNQLSSAESDLNNVASEQVKNAETLVNVTESSSLCPVESDLEQTDAQIVVSQTESEVLSGAKQFTYVSDEIIMTLDTEGIATVNNTVCDKNLLSSSESFLNEALFGQTGEETTSANILNVVTLQEDDAGESQAVITDNSMALKLSGGDDLGSVVDEIESSKQNMDVDNSMEILSAESATSCLNEAVEERLEDDITQLENEDFNSDEQHSKDMVESLIVIPTTTESELGLNNAVLLTESDLRGETLAPTEQSTVESLTVIPTTTESELGLNNAVLLDASSLQSATLALTKQSTVVTITDAYDQTMGDLNKLDTETSKEETAGTTIDMTEENQSRIDFNKAIVYEGSSIGDEMKPIFMTGANPISTSNDGNSQQKDVGGPDVLDIDEILQSATHPVADDQMNVPEDNTEAETIKSSKSDEGEIKTVPPRRRLRSNSMEIQENVEISAELSDVKVAEKSNSLLFIEAIPTKVRKSTRIRTRSITEENDDNISVASDSSNKTTRSTRSQHSTRSTRSNRKIDADEPPGTPKRTRSKPKVLPAIAEDLSNEAEDDSQSYADARRLTRAQKLLLSKAAASKKVVTQTIITRKREREVSGQDVDADSEDDRASVASNETKASARSTRSKKSRDNLTPVRQSQRLMEKDGLVEKKTVAYDESDKESIASTSTANSRRRRGRAATAAKK